MNEIAEIGVLAPEGRIDYFIKRIDSALDNFTLLTPSVYKPSEYTHLASWKEVFNRLKS